MSGERFRVLAQVPIVGSVGIYTFPQGAPEQWSSINENVNGWFPEFIQEPSHIAGTDAAKADSAAIISALKGVQQQRTQFQGLVALGELRETLHMLHHPFAGARKLIDSYFQRLRASKAYKSASRRKGSNGTSVKAHVNEFLTEASNTWLEVAFGLKPLISDVKAAAEAVARYQNDSRRSVVVGYGEDVAASVSTNRYPIANHLWVYTTTRDITTQMVRYKVTMDYSRSAAFGSNERLLELNGLTVEQFVPTIYELVPWSFLLDYFSNVGEVISAGCTSQAEVKFVVRTERLATTREVNIKSGLSPFAAPGFWENCTQAGQSISSRANVARSSTAKLDLPNVYFSLPGRASQWENMAALWKSNERSLLSRFRG